MKANIKVLHRCLALLLCIVMVAALLPEMTVSAALETPQTKVQRLDDRVRVTWKPITGAVNYRIFRMDEGSSTWKVLGTTPGTKWGDTTVQNGKKYTYTVRCVTKDGKTYTSAHDAGATITWWKCDTPNPKVSVVSNGLKISWGAISGAEKYRVFRKSGSEWVIVGVTSGTSLVDESVAPGQTYTYTVRCCAESGKPYTSAYKTAGATGTYAIEFEITKLNCVVDGVQITWQAISGVSNYSIKRYTGQDWREIGTASGSSFTDIGADFHDGLASGTKYTYKVSYTVGGSTKTTPEKSVTYYASPEIQDVDVDQNNFTVKWKAVPGVSLYRVFRRLNTTEPWQHLADVSGTSYTDKSVASGLNYYYTVRCLSADGKSYISGHDPIGKQADYIGMPTLISTSVENSGIVFKWNAVGGVTKYQVYRKTGSSSWAPYPNSSTKQTVTGDVGSFTDTNAASGETYYYTVACDDGAKQSDYDPKGLSCKKLSNPVLNKLYIYNNGVQVTWYGVDSAVKYRVFRKEASGTVWKAVGDTTSLSYTDTTVVNKGKYVYTVRCVAANGSYASGYDETGKTVQFFSTPTLKSAVVDTHVSSGTGSVTITWGAVEGVTQYSVYRRIKNSNGSYTSWTNLTHSASGTSYKDTTVKSGITYNYTVRCSNGSAPTSYFNTNGISVYFLAAPALITPSVSKGAIVVKWKYVDGAKGYKVYRKVPGGQWQGVATINSPDTLTFKDTRNLVRNQQYIYTVRAFHGSNFSGYLSAGTTPVKAQ